MQVVQLSDAFRVSGKPARPRMLRALDGILWRLGGVLWPFAHICKCRRSHAFHTVSAVPDILCPVR